MDLDELDARRIPRHVAIVMDGNGRWAQKRGLPRTEGHAAGEDALYAGPGNDTVYSVGDYEGDLVDCGSGIDTVKKGSDQNLDSFVNCERFVS